MQTCGSCGSNGLETVLNMGKLPLANALVSKNDRSPEIRYPLELAFCSNCGLAQITERIHPEVLFSHFLSASSTSELLRELAERTAEQFFEGEFLNHQSTVIDIGSNDGLLLSHYKKLGTKVLGIEPSKELSETANAAGVPTRRELFDKSLARDLKDEGIKGDVIHAHNVLQQTLDPNSFAEGLRVLLKPEGTAVIEVPYVVDLIQDGAFDTIYHDNYFYWSLTALNSLLQRHGLAIYAAERSPRNGGTLGILVCHGGTRGQQDSFVDLLDWERSHGIGHVAYYLNFASRVKALGESILEFLTGLRDDGKTVAGYGASGRGITLLNRLSIETDLVQYIVDKSKRKHGRLTPGGRIPIKPVSALVADPPDYLIPLARNFTDEIVEQQVEFTRNGGNILQLIPEISIALARTTSDQ